MTNKKLKNIVWVCAVFFLTTVVYFFIGNVAPRKESTSTITPVVEQKVPVLRVESFTDSSSSIQLTVEYPQFVQSASTSTEKLINTAFKKEAKKLYDEQLKELQNSISSEFPMRGDVTFERKVQKDKAYIDVKTGIFSVSYANYTDTGGAHGTFFYTSQTIDMNTGITLALKDILQGEYETILVQELEKEIRLGESTETCVNCSSELVTEGFEVNIPKSFLLTSKGIVFLYGAYELGPYVFTSGGQEVLVSKELLQGFISRVW